MRRSANWNDGRDPFILQQLLEASVLIAVYKFVDKRCNNRLVAFRCNCRKVIANNRIGECRRRWAGKQAVDYSDAARACVGEEFFNLRNGRDAARTPVVVTSLLDEI